MSTHQGGSVHSIRPFKSSEEYLYAMKEDLAEWLKDMYHLEIIVDNFIEILENGSVLCQHANNVTEVAREFFVQYPHLAEKLQLPKSGVKLNMMAQPGSFLARDNVSNFIQWCRKEMDIKDVIMFETEDLVHRKNEKNFLLCLLELARRASRFGMSAPMLIQMEEQIEEEIRQEMDLPPQEIPVPKPQRKLCDFKNLDQMVQNLVSRCTCPVQFSMVKVSEGKYRVGESSTLIFVRILRKHLMVRVGGGWDTLAHYLDKHDPCRCASLFSAHKPAIKLGSLQKQVRAVHEVKTQLTPRLDNPSKLETTLIVSRSQSPLPPVEWRTYSSERTRTISSSNSLDDNENSPSFKNSQTPPNDRRSMSIRAHERSATLSRKLFTEDTQDPQQLGNPQSGHYRHHHSTSSLASQLTGSEEEYSYISEVFSESQSGRQMGKHTVMNLKEPPKRDAFLSHTQSANKKVISATQQNNIQQGLIIGHQSVTVQDSRPKTPSRFIRPPSPSKQIHFFYNQQNKGVEQNIKTQTNSCTRSSSPVKQTSLTYKQEFNKRPATPSRINYSSSQYKDGDKSAATEIITFHDHVRAKPSVSSEERTIRTGRATPTIHLNRENTNLPLKMQPKPNVTESSHSIERDCMYTPLPIDPEQEKQIYRSLEDEIRTNIKILEGDSEENNPENDTAAHDFNVLGKSTLRLSSSTLKTPRGQEGVPRSGVYINTAWQSGASYDDVITELTKGHVKLNNVDVENWISKIPSKGMVKEAHTSQRNKVRENGHTASLVRKKTLSSEMKGSKQKQLPSQRARQLALENKKKTVENVLEKQVSTVSGDSKEAIPEKIKLSHGLKPKKSLKKPERVPSIYKLKLRPKIRPRRDNRPEKKPSRIPTPVSYRQVPSRNNAKALKRTQANKISVAQTLNESQISAVNSEDLDSGDEICEHSAPLQAVETPITGENNQSRTEEEEESWV